MVKKSLILDERVQEENEKILLWLTSLRTIIKFFPNGIFTSVGKYSNSDVELTVKKVVLGK